MIAKPPVKIWDRAPEVEVLLLSPEQLVSPNFEALLKDKTYQSRVVALGVDEIHLLNTWGQTFRRSFEQIGLMRARFTSRPVLIGLTATLQSGPWFRSVCHFLGLHPGHFYLIRRSNMRYDIRIIFRTVLSGARAYAFPELDWVLDGDRRVVVFCPTISLGNRVITYLYARSNGLEDLDQRLRMYNSLNWASYNSDTLSFMHNDGRSRVTVATDALAVGIDVTGTDDVVIYDTVLPSDTDSILQKAGRIRDGRGRDSRVVIYLPKNATKLAEAALNELEKERRVSASQAKEKSAVDAGVARLVLAPCKVDLLNELYDNPPRDEPCTCTTCTAKSSIARPEQCNCSGCAPEGADTTTASTTRAAPKKPAIPIAERLTRAMRDDAHERFARHRNSLREDCDETLQDLYPPEEFLPDTLIDALLDKCYTVTDILSLKKLLSDYPLLEPHCASIMAVMDELRNNFDVMRAEAKATQAAKAKATRERKRAERMEADATADTSGSGTSEDDGAALAQSEELKGSVRGMRVEGEGEGDSLYNDGRGGKTEGQVQRLVIKIPGGRFRKA